MTTEPLMRGALPRVEWSAILVGVLLALALHVLFGLFGVAFGFAARPDKATDLALAAAWGLLVPFWSMLAGAVVAVRSSSSTTRRAAVLNALLVWCVALVAGAVLLSGSLAAGARTAAHAVGGLGLLDPSPVWTPAAAAASGAAALGSLLGLLGALLGSVIGRRALAGERLFPRRNEPLARRPYAGYHPDADDSAPLTDATPSEHEETPPRPPAPGRSVH